MSDRRRAVPAVGRLLTRPAVAEAIAHHGREVVIAALRTTLDEARAGAAAGVSLDADELIAATIARVAARPASELTPVINATGVLLHTNLGRAPLSADAVAALTPLLAPSTWRLTWSRASGAAGMHPSGIR